MQPVTALLLILIGLAALAFLVPLLLDIVQQEPPPSPTAGPVFIVDLSPWDREDGSIKVYLYNGSEKTVEVAWAFIEENDACDKLDLISGSVPPGGTAPITLDFNCSLSPGYYTLVLALDNGMVLKTSLEVH